MLIISFPGRIIHRFPIAKFPYEPYTEYRHRGFSAAEEKKQNPSTGGRKSA